MAVILSTSDAPIAVACTFLCCAHLLYSGAQPSAHTAWRFIWQQRALATQGVSSASLSVSSGSSALALSPPRGYPLLLSLPA